MSHNPNIHDGWRQKDIIVNHDDSSPKSLYTFPSGTVIARVYVEVTETWDDGSKALEVGDASDPNGFCTDVGAGLGSVGSYNTEHDEWGEYLWHVAGSHSRDKVYSAQTAVIATFVGTGSGGSQGQCIVHILWRGL